MKNHWRETAAAIGLVIVGKGTAQAMDYLERRGKRFLVDFGYLNALDVAREMRRVDRRKRYAKRKK